MGICSSNQSIKATSSQGIPPLLSCQALKGLLQKPTRPLVVLEADVGKQVERDFQAGHIPTARYFDQLECTTPTELMPRGLPEVKCFEALLTRLGVSNHHHVVLYDRSPAGFMAAGRAWCILRAYGVDNLSILNGGYHGWVKEINEIETTASNEQPAEKPFSVKLNKSRLRDYDEMLTNLSSETSDSRRVQVVDARPPNLFYGAEAGHMPRAIHLPYASMIDQTNQRLKPNDQLAGLFKEAGVDLSKPAIYTCQTGMTASNLAFIAHLLGQKNISLYAGAFTEWQKRAPANMIIKGDGKAPVS